MPAPGAASTPADGMEVGEEPVVGDCVAQREKPSAIATVRIAARLVGAMKAIHS